MFIYLLSTDGLSKINPLTFSSWKGNSPDRTKQSAVTGVKELHEHFLRAKRELHKVHHQGDGHNLKIKGGKKLECLAKWPVVKLHILGLNKNKNSRRVVLLNCSWPFIEKYAHHDKKTIVIFCDISAVPTVGAHIKHNQSITHFLILSNPCLSFLFLDPYDATEWDL